ncbi:MAG: ThiF family adenylyltransferase [Chloroflexi bacterium]|nr:ThiF family adenylyltransferase [Chloroflexota bacterium]
MTFDPSYRDAVPLLLKSTRRVRLLLVGCGGTGSWLAPDLVRLARAFARDERPIELTFVDPDVVEARNVLRQNFCAAELGRAKAQTLALRYGAAWGVEMRAVMDYFDPTSAPPDWDTLVLLIGCVDNAPARRMMAERLKHNGEVPQLWWLDLGNDRDSGQVLLGSAWQYEQFGEAFKGQTFCQCLPAPSLQEPALLEAQPERAVDASCAAQEAQSLTINKRLAAEAADYVCRWLGGAPLLKFATYLYLASGTARSRYITPASLAAACNAGAAEPLAIYRV